LIYNNLNSNYPIPEDAPPPANPMKCPLPIFDANKEAPIYLTNYKEIFF
jgi:hypothetical protein